MTAQSTFEPTPSSSSTSSSGDQDEPDSCSYPPYPEPGRQPVDPSSVTLHDARAAQRPVVDVGWVHSHLLQAMEHVGRPVQRISVQLIDDVEMTRLHLLHCDIDSTTDVLTFDASDEFAADMPIDADIAVCVDEAARQSGERGHDLNVEVLLYALHGVLHCAGYDDLDEADFRKMHAEEDRLLRLIGVGPVFNLTDEDSGQGR